MEALLNARKIIKDFMDRYDLFFIPCLKFILAFFTFVMISRTLPFMDALSNVFILVILALLCGILPVNAIAVIGIVMIILQCFSASLVIGAASLCFFLLLLILLLRFVPSDMLAVVLTPFSFILHVAAAVPIAMGLLRGRSSAAAGVSGIAVYCFVSCIPEAAKNAASGKMTLIELVQDLIRSFIGHPELILSSVVFTAVVLIVNLIRKMVTKYTYLIAVITGCVFYLILRLLGRFFLQTKGSLIEDLITVLLSAVICLIIAFFAHCADYSRTAVLQFEDDNYYYYVKAVPKRTPDTPDEYDEEETDFSYENEEDFDVSADDWLDDDTDNS